MTKSISNYIDRIKHTSFNRSLNDHYTIGAFRSTNGQFCFAYGLQERFSRQIDETKKVPNPVS